MRCGVLVLDDDGDDDGGGGGVFVRVCVRACVRAHVRAFGGCLQDDDMVSCRE